ncbi:MAG: hypothetical protein ACI8XO_002398 [Verrucomicrobiales bacterium]|jgi:hypothetical protein
MLRFDGRSLGTGECRPEMRFRVKIIAWIHFSDNSHLPSLLRRVAEAIPPQSPPAITWRVRPFLPRSGRCFSKAGRVRPSKPAPGVWQCLAQRDSAARLPRKLKSMVRSATSLGCCVIRQFARSKIRSRACFKSSRRRIDLFERVYLHLRQEDNSSDVSINAH